MLLEIKNLSKGYLSKKAVKNLSLTVEQGKIYGFLGPNGSGKTTFMKMVAGLLNPSSGDILVEGNKVGVKSKEMTAYMSTENFIYPYMKIKTVGEFYKDFYKDFNMERYKELIAYMDLEMDMKVSSLSSGMASKMKIAVTLSRDSKLIMLDEPLNGIDLVAREKILNTIVKCANDNNTIIVSSHLVDEMEKILDQVIFIKNGELVLIGDAETVREERGKSIVDLYKEVYA
ncbi:ABC transporter ATP-binding protein [Vallitalea sp.]|jgi:ABC-2 type transport system ATP-binding protein|uniref:ABC transporter ATP-binding protein n=1 Tax=Vallitalea sp. TaxID=1882829 RepID=UPI0025F14E18|nr:ABC transporter ATP-binding protein [Vallitalea sp.]MCT4686326.1 ABC transporter ATP-binding protein [Vallitalea sp.]